MRSPLRLDCLRASSYHNRQPVAVGEPRHRRPDEAGCVKGQHVLLVDDILDTGKTLAAVAGLIKAKGAASVKTCVLLDKKARPRRAVRGGTTSGSRFPTNLSSGYGLDFNERYRNLPCIGVLKPKYYGG